jgi:hypothetical protein
MMIAKFLAGSSYDPDTVKIIGAAFDDAWSEISHNFASDTLRAEARDRLAHAVLMVAKDSLDPIKLKIEALKIMSLTYGGSWLDLDGKLSA